MSAYRFVTLTCDLCGEIYDSGESRTAKDARACARNEGWHCRPGRDECPLHHGYRRTFYGYERDTDAVAAPIGEEKS